jgi:hypothetical protein
VIETLIHALHLAGTLWMTGLVLFVAVVHYPLMAAVGREAFVAYEKRHVSRTGLIVGPLMLTEAATAGLILTRQITGGTIGTLGGALSIAGIVLLAVCWGVTFIASVPQHERLSRGFDEATHRGLVAWHWVRTVAWVGRSIIAVWLAVLSNA